MWEVELLDYSNHETLIKSNVRSIKIEQILVKSGLR